MIFRLIRALIFVYMIIYIAMGLLNYRTASQNFYAVDRHFALYLSISDDISSSIMKGSWCALIATPEYSEKTDEEVRGLAEKFFENEIAHIAVEQGYSVPELKDWFLRYASYDIKSMPIREFLLDWKGEESILYREIDLSKKPDRDITYFFSSKEMPKDAFGALLVVGIPVIFIWFIIHNYFNPSKL